MFDSPLIGLKRGRGLDVVVRRNRFKGWVASSGSFWHPNVSTSRQFSVGSFCSEASLGSVEVAYGIIATFHSVTAIAWTAMPCCTELAA